MGRFALKIVLYLVQKQENISFMGGQSAKLLFKGTA